jgi:hypothetical protein
LGGEDLMVYATVCPGQGPRFASHLGCSGSEMRLNSSSCPGSRAAREVRRGRRSVGGTFLLTPSMAMATRPLRGMPV